MSPQHEVFTILNDAGAVLVRQRKHKIFRFQDGRIWVIPSTPGDSRAWRNNLAGLRRHLTVRTSQPVQLVNFRPSQAMRA
jgi:hypothetical protein